MTVTPGPAWPTGRSSADAVLAQFGESRAELVGWALTTGDPLADAVVAEMHELGMRNTRPLLEQGISNGVASLPDPPPAMGALLTQAETPPAYVTDELLDGYTRPWFSSPGPVHMISLSAGSLVRAYESPSIAHVLTLTGRLVEGAERRIEETGKWLTAMMLPGALRPGQPGYVATLQVRMLHAHMRRLAYDRGYQSALHGAPINQVDLARTWMDFTVTSYRAEELLGFDLSPREQDQLYRYWWYAGHLLGIDARLIGGITNNEAAKRVDDMLQTVTGPVTEESVVLADATLGSVTGSLNELLRVPRGLGRPVLNAITRRIHGPGMSHDLRIPAEPAADLWLTPTVAAIRIARDRRRSKPAAWETEIEKHIADTRTRLGETEDAAAFERGATGSHD